MTVRLHRIVIAHMDIDKFEKQKKEYDKRLRDAARAKGQSFAQLCKEYFGPQLDSRCGELSSVLTGACSNFRQTTTQTGRTNGVRYGQTPRFSMQSSWGRSWKSYRAVVRPILVRGWIGVVGMLCEKEGPEMPEPPCNSPEGSGVGQPSLRAHEEFLNTTNWATATFYACWPSGWEAAAEARQEKCSKTANMD